MIENNACKSIIKHYIVFVIAEPTERWITKIKHKSGVVSWKKGLLQF
jgi:hypothetical protein